MIVYFKVIGEPIPQGSMRGYVRGGRVALTSDNPNLHSWRDVIGWEARRHFSEMWEGPVAVTAGFRLSRPKSVKRQWPTVKPDLDKLVRSLGDALTGVAYKDDSLVLRWEVSKVYCEPGEQPGVDVWVTSLEVQR